LALKDIPDREADTRKALARVEVEIANFIRAVASGVSAKSIVDALATAEAKRDQLTAQMERLQAAPKPGDIAIHPTAVRDLIANVAAALSQDADGAVGREALPRYLGTITMRPVEADGARHYVAEGNLDATEALAGSLENTGSPGRWTRTAYVSVVGA
jgi:hypothetical protein